MEKIVTGDGSTTFRNKEADETYHSISGAAEEAVKKFVDACGIKEGDVILDICFGLGYNSAAAMDRAKVNIIGLENDMDILKKIEEIDAPFKSYSEIKKAAKHLHTDKIVLHIGDARQTVKSLSMRFDAVFLDPFSPKKNPELWTEEFFREIYKRMKPGAKLATYSCARIVRDNLKSVGFKVEDWPAVGRKAPSTVAIKPL